MSFDPAPPGAPVASGTKGIGTAVSAGDGRVFKRAGRPSRTARE